MAVPEVSRVRRDFTMSANVATPYLATPLPRCAFVLDRHTHKNGGSTMRSIFADNDRLDGWVYWGYSLNQQAPFAQRLVAALQPPRGNGSCFASGRSSLRWMRSNGPRRTIWPASRSRREGQSLLPRRIDVPISL